MYSRVTHEKNARTLLNIFHCFHGRNLLVSADLIGYTTPGIIQLKIP